MIWTFTAITIAMSGLDIMHPYFWFPLFASLYGTANAIIIAEGYATRIQSYSREQVLLPFIGLVAAVLAIGPDKYKIEFKKNNTIENKTLDSVLNIIVFVVIIGSFILHARGYASKVIMRREGDLIYKFGVHVVRFMTLFSLICVARNFTLGMRRAFFKIAITGTAALIFTLFTGERDVFFRFGFTMLLLLVAYKVIKPRHLVIIVPFVILVMAGSTYFKNYFVRGVYGYSTGNLLNDFLGSDFSAPGGNLQKVIENSWTKGCQGMKLLFTELFGPFLIGVRTFSPTAWFGTYVYQTSYGRAFTLVGTGYIMAGTVGVIIVFAVVGVIVRFFYARASRNVYWLTSYIYVASSVIFSFRQSLQTVTDSILKHVIFGILLAMLIDKFTISGRKR